MDFLCDQCNLPEVFISEKSDGSNKRFLLRFLRFFSRSCLLGRGTIVSGVGRDRAHVSGPSPHCPSGTPTAFLSDLTSRMGTTSLSTQKYVFPFVHEQPF